MHASKPAYKIPVSVLVVIHTEQLEVLLLERTGTPGFWQSVTGSLDAPSEPLWDAAQREVAEETGLLVGGAALPAHCLLDWQEVNEYEIFPQWRQRYGPGVMRNTEHVFGLRLACVMPVRLSAREHTQYTWMPWVEAAAKCFSPSNAAAILRLPQRYAAG